MSKAYFTLINTFDSLDTLGFVVSSHRSLGAAQRAKLQVPAGLAIHSTIVATPRLRRRGEFLYEGDVMAGVDTPDYSQCG